MIVDSSKDLPLAEQTAFLLCFLVRHESRFEIVERFLKIDVTKQNLKLFKSLLKH